MPNIMLDPGHGGYDPGACGNGLQEKDITLAIALQLVPLLVYNGIGVGLTRTGNYAPNHLENNLNGELTARATLSDNYKADLFVSIHINSGGGTGQEILISATGGNAEKAANKLLPYLVNTGGWANRGVKVQNVLVLRETACPAILTENGFIDSASDSAKLKDPTFTQGIAVAHAKGICDYFGIAYKEGVTPMVVTPPPVKGPIAVDDIWLTVRVREPLAGQAIKDINGLGLACQRLELA